MFTVFQKNRTWFSKCFFPALLVCLCFNEIRSSLVNTSNIDISCSNGSTVTLSWWNRTPYVFENNTRIQGILVDIVERGFLYCCDIGVQLRYANTGSYNNIGQKSVFNSNNNASFIPASRMSYIEPLKPFVGLIDAPGIAVITQQSVPGADLLMAILASWPILIFIITTISLSGIVIWLLDYKKNPAHFPEFFPMGVFEGFWWAAVTMTTVGYGDRVPKSVHGRLFAVVWITAGLVILAMFMGIVTASLTSSSWVDINHFWGVEVAVINGSAEYQFAILQSANVQAQDQYEDMYSSVSTGKSKVALVDQYSAACHHDYFSSHKLTIATIIDVPIVYGILLPTQGSQNIQECLKSYTQSFGVERYSYIAKYITNIQESSINDGTEYFRGSLFGYSVYAMTGIFLLILGIGAWWQYYWEPRHGEWRQSKDIAMKEMEMTSHSSQLKNTLTSMSPQWNKLQMTSLTPINGRQMTSSSKLNGYPAVSHIAHVQNSSLEHPKPHCSRTQQCMGVRQLLDEYREYERSWTKKFIYLQEKHRREQIEVFNLDNDGYNM